MDHLELWELVMAILLYRETNAGGRGTGLDPRPMQRGLSLDP